MSSLANLAAKHRAVFVWFIVERARERGCVPRDLVVHLTGGVEAEGHPAFAVEHVDDLSPVLRAAVDLIALPENESGLTILAYGPEASGRVFIPLWFDRSAFVDAHHRDPSAGVRPAPRRKDPTVRSLLREDEITDGARMASVEVSFRVGVYIGADARLALVNNESVQDFDEEGPFDEFGCSGVLPVLADGTVGLWPEAQELDFAVDRREFTAQVIAALNRALGPTGVGVNAKGGDA
jgi:hypothetical protein